MEVYITCREVHMTLGEARSGERHVVVSVGGSGALRRRLLEFGFVPGTEVRVIRRAPFGGPVEVALRGYLLTLRRDAAGTVAIR